MFEGKQQVKFVHVADVHLDSPLRGLEAYDGAPLDRLRLATRRALDNIVELCVAERVDFLLIAGDLFDTDCKDFHAALAAANQLRRLQRAGIPVYLILGNHDSYLGMTRQVPWPDNVTVFSHEQAHTVRHPTLPVAIHGMSYPKRAVTQNLVPDYPQPIADCFNIGLLHTNAGSNPNHDPYAPCSVADLAAKGYDYWALGHVHDFQILHERPFIAYSGNTQGRHARELGVKGCLLVRVEDGIIQPPDFRPTDVLRWFRQSIELQPNDGEEELIDRTRATLREVSQAAEGRLAAVRLEYTGRCLVHGALASDSERQQLMTNIRGLAGDFGDLVWIEKIRFRTQSPLDRESLRRGQDLLGELLRETQTFLDDVQRRQELTELLRPVALKAGPELAADGVTGQPNCFDDPEKLAEWLRDAEELLLGYLVEDGA